MDKYAKLEAQLALERSQVIDLAIDVLTTAISKLQQGLFVGWTTFELGGDSFTNRFPELTHIRDIQNNGNDGGIGN